LVWAFVCPLSRRRQDLNFSPKLSQMKPRLALLPLALAGVVAVLLAQTPPVAMSGPKQKAGSDAPFSLSSPAFEDGAAIPARHTRIGDGISPALAWVNPPPGTKSFVLHVHDVDTPQRVYDSFPTHLHWLVWNIPGTATGLPEALVTGSAAAGGILQIAYHGPGPDQAITPAGRGLPRINPTVHRYRFELWALDQVIDLPPAKDAVATRGTVLTAMNGHVLGQAFFTGTFATPGF
jgi:Raf kinase inhibitor-like YbhB/YbcL family protein